ncbi:MAG TPA: dTDP-4-dehydrorhamnose 3,5-epimerase family protein [Chloroflexia bacterium]|nr:dTDP-4-dehydrorhamnose 3,5-epimerase family protein [Chloroflexia bacterium]
MLAMTNYISRTSLPGLLKVERPVRQDQRGFFHEVVRPEELNKVSGDNFQVRQVNHSFSKEGVLRGLHAERWDKVVWIARGKALSAIVDIRPDSPTFGRHEMFELTAENGTALYIPQGFANSVYAITDIDYIYLVSKVYDGSDTFAVTWDDTDIAIPWPNRNPVLSERDLKNPRLREIYPEKFN